MNKYYEAIRFVENKIFTIIEWKDRETVYSVEYRDATRAIENLYELLDLYIKEKTKVVFK